LHEKEDFDDEYIEKQSMLQKEIKGMTLSNRNRTEMYDVKRTINNDEKTITTKTMHELIIPNLNIY